MSAQESSTSQLVPFQFHEKTVTTITDAQGAPWFIASDVCAALEVKNVSAALARLDADEKAIVSNDTPGGRQDVLIMSEAGMYRLTLSSRKRIAKEFQRWVTHEVLPTLRKTGRYDMQAAQHQGPSSLVLAQQDMHIWSELATLFQAPLHIALQEGVKYVEKTHGVDLRPLLLASPTQTAIPDDEVMLEPTQLAERLGYPSAIMMNKALQAIGWQTKYTGVWEATDLGTPHCVRHAWINKGKSGYNYCWRLSAVRDALGRSIPTTQKGLMYA